MKLYLHATSLGLFLLTCVGTWQLADAQPSHPTILEAPAALSMEEIVSRLVERNLQRSRALESYQGTRTYRLDYRGFPGSRKAEMTVEVNYKAPSTKEFIV